MLDKILKLFQGKHPEKLMFIRAALVDIRTLNAFEKNAFPISKDKDVYVCCKPGSRSASGYTFLLKRGHPNGWQSVGLPVVESPTISLLHE